MTTATLTASSGGSFSDFGSRFRQFVARLRSALEKGLETKGRDLYAAHVYGL